MLQHECRFPTQLNFLPPDPLCNTSFCIYLYVKLQVFIHGIDVIKDVMCNSWNDSHELRVVQLPLWTQNQTVTRKAWLRYTRGESLVQTHLPPVGPYERVCCSGGAFARCKCTEKVAERLNGLALFTRRSTYLFCQLLPFAKSAVLPLSTLSLCD